jgi:hypothetical protein
VNASKLLAMIVVGFMIVERVIVISPLLALASTETGLAHEWRTKKVDSISRSQ